MDARQDNNLQDALAVFASTVSVPLLLQLVDQRPLTLVHDTNEDEHEHGNLPGASKAAVNQDLFIEILVD